jgi:hypothetical protein
MRHAVPTRAFAIRAFDVSVSQIELASQSASVAQGLGTRFPVSVGLYLM